MSNQQLRLRKFSGGLSDDDKYGPADSFSDSEALNFRKNPGRLTLQDKLTTEVSGSSFKGPRTYDAARLSDGTVYLANGGFTYKRTPGANGAVGTYAEEQIVGQSIPCADLVYRPDSDALFLFSSNTIHELSPLSNNPSYKIDKYSYYKFYNNPPQSGVTIVAATLPTAIAESVSDIIPFTCTKEPLDHASFIVDTIGTGDWTLTVHDTANRTVAAQTITNANVPKVGDIIAFSQFTGTNRLNIGASYHCHLTVSTGTSKVAANSTNLKDALCTIYANRLVTTSAFIGHASIQFGAKTYFCNERYIGEWEFLDLSGGNISSGYNAHRIVLPAEYVGIGVTTYSENIVAACAILDSIESTSGSSFGSAGTGALIFWDATSTFFNFIVEVPQGVPEGVFSHNNRVYFIARGRLYYWAGGDIIEVFEFPGVDEFLIGAGGDAPKTDTYLSAGRHCMTVHEGLLTVGFPLQTANRNLKIGVYTIGANKSNMPEAISMDYVSCGGNTTTSFDTSTSPDTPSTGISFVKSFGGTMLVSWTNGLGATGSGMDRLNDSSTAAASGKYRSLWFDDGTPDIQKTPLIMKVTCLALPTGCTITPVIELDHGAEQLGDPITATGVDGIFNLDVSTRFYEARLGINLTSSGGLYPEAVSITFEFDDNRQNSNSTRTQRSIG